MLLLKNEHFTIESDTRLIKAEDAATLMQAEEVLQLARQKADAILASAETEFEKQRKLGFDQGMDEGQDGIIQQKMAMVESSVAYLEKMENRVVDIVIAALHKFLDQIGERELIVQIVRKAMSVVIRNQKEMTIRISGKNVPVVKERINELMEQYPGLHTVNVQEDNHLDGTACVLETDAGIVDASLKVQLAAVEKALRKCFKNE